MQRYTFPPAGAPKLVFDPARSDEGVADGGFRVIGDREVAGWRRGRYPVFFVARFSRPFDSSGTIGKGGWVGWDEGGEVTVSFGMSFVDEDGARRNLEAEAPDFDFDAMRSQTRAAWNRELSKIRVSGGSELDLKSFYTALYRSQLHPNTFTDVDGRYRGMDDQIHKAKGRIQYSNFSSWDLYKSWHQLIATIQPERYGDMLLSLLADHREGGFIPRWKEQSIDAAHMSGDPAIPMIADGVCRGVREEKDARALYDAAKHLVARRDAELLELGWLPDRPGTTLEYGVADFALALLAHRLGNDAEAAQHLQRSLNYRNILDPETHWIRGRDAEGNWATPFDPAGGESPEQTTGRGFQEGNSWQYSWLAMHDGRKLMELMGGDEVAIERLDQMFSLPAEAQNRLTAFGIVYRFAQWAPGNEHDLEVPWMYHFAGQPWRAAAELADARHLYRPTIDGLPGNDDLGGLSSWHLLDMLGLGALVPGAPYWALGSPAFERAEIDTGRRHVHDRVARERPLRRERVAERRAARPRVDPRLRDDGHAPPRALDRAEQGVGHEQQAAERNRPLGLRLRLSPSGPSTPACASRRRPHALAEVLAAEAALAQLDQLALEVGRELAGMRAQLADDALVALERQRRVGRDLGGERRGPPPRARPARPRG